jgi:hypothetical protein
MIQPIITAALLGILLFALLSRQAGQVLRLGFAAAVVAGLVVTWAPDLSNRIARWLGVGRGADLLFYMWILISLLVLVMVHLKFLRLSRQITELARAVALLRAERPAASGDEE